MMKVYKYEVLIIYKWVAEDRWRMDTWKHRDGLNFCLTTEMVPPYGRCVDWKEFQAKSGKNLERQSFYHKSSLTRFVTSESFPIKRGCRKTHSTPALVSNLTQKNNNRSLWISLQKKEKKNESVSRSFVFNTATPGTVAHQAPLSIEFSRHAYCSGFLFSSVT